MKTTKQQGDVQWAAGVSAEAKRPDARKGCEPSHAEPQRLWKPVWAGAWGNRKAVKAVWQMSDAVSHTGQTDGRRGTEGHWGACVGRDPVRRDGALPRHRARSGSVFRI